MRRLPYIGIAILVVGLVALFLVGDDGTAAGMNRDDLASLVYAGALITVIGGALVVRPARAMWQHAVIWALIIVGLAVAYEYRLAAQSFIAGLGG